MIDPGADEQILDRFRQWLQNARHEADQLAEGQQASECLPAEGGQEIGLYQLVEEYTSLRHELKLQTRSARGLDEQVESLLKGLREAIDALRSIQPKEAEAAWSAGRSLATALAELDEALDRGRVQFDKVGQRLAVAPTEALLADLDELHARQPWFVRQASRRYPGQVRNLLAARQDGKERRSLVETLLEGYGLIQQRLKRALGAERIEKIATVGVPVDPERMMVVDVVDVPGRPAGTVVEEIRRGYAWNGRLLRYAEVRAARAPSAGSINI
jgi:molecular chaperone GrpE